MLVAAAPATAGVGLPPGWAGHTRTGALWHTNVTNADRAPDVIADLEFRHSSAAFRRFGLTRDDLLLLGARFDASAWTRFDGLDRFAGGPTLAWQRKTGLGAHATVFRLETAAGLVGTRESGRHGRSGHIAAEVTQRISFWGRLHARHERNRHDASEHAFDRTSSETNLGFGADLPAQLRVNFGVARRDGGVLSYATPPHPVLITAGKALTTVTTFDRSAPMIAYYFMARTHLARIECIRVLDSHRALAVGFEYRDTSRGRVSYLNRLLTLEILHQF